MKFRFKTGILKHISFGEEKNGTGRISRYGLRRICLRREKLSRAAERCFITQPSLSKSVKKLENNIGFALFDRGSSPVEVTRDGTKRHLAYFRQMMELQKKLELYCQAVRCRSRSDLTICAPSFFCTCLLPPGGVRFPT